MKKFFLGENSDFTPFTLQHLVVASLFIAIGLFIIYYAKKQSKRIQIRIGNVFASAIASAVIVSVFINIYKGEFDYQTDLPLHLCRLLALLLPVFSIKRKYLWYEVLLFLVLAGTSQAIFTPDEKNFMNFRFFRYWILHVGLVMFMIYATVIYKMRPTLKSVFKSFLGMQVYLVTIYCINYILGSNYFYTNRKPEAKTALDFFGEWPMYIVVVELLIIPYFLFIYLPFYLSAKENRKLDTR